MIKLKKFNINIVNYNKRNVNNPKENLLIYDTIFLRKLVGKKIKRKTIEFIYKRIDRSYLNDSRNTKNKEESS